MPTDPDHLFALRIQTWATQEARKRLEASEGVWKYEPSPNSGYPSKD